VKHHSPLNGCFAPFASFAGGKTSPHQSLVFIGLSRTSARRLKHLRLPDYLSVNFSAGVGGVRFVGVDVHREGELGGDADDGVAGD